MTMSKALIAPSRPLTRNTVVLESLNFSTKSTTNSAKSNAATWKAAYVSLNPPLPSAQKKLSVPQRIN
jgi:hypothetical protein